MILFLFCSLNLWIIKSCCIPLIAPLTKSLSLWNTLSVQHLSPLSICLNLGSKYPVWNSLLFSQLPPDPLGNVKMFVNPCSKHKQDFQSHLRILKEKDRIPQYLQRMFVIICPHMIWPIRPFIDLSNLYLATLNKCMTLFLLRYRVYTFRTIFQVCIYFCLKLNCFSVTENLRNVQLKTQCETKM